MRHPRTFPTLAAEAQAQAEAQTGALTEAQAEAHTGALTEAQADAQTEAQAEARTGARTGAHTGALTEAHTEAQESNEREQAPLPKTTTAVDGGDAATVFNDVHAVRGDTRVSESLAFPKCEPSSPEETEASDASDASVQKGKSSIPASEDVTSLSGSSLRAQSQARAERTAGVHSGASMHMEHGTESTQTTGLSDSEATDEQSAPPASAQPAKEDAANAEDLNRTRAVSATYVDDLSYAFEAEDREREGAIFRLL